PAQQRHAALLQPRHLPRVAEVVDHLVEATQRGARVDPPLGRVARHARHARVLGEQLALGVELRIGARASGVARGADGRTTVALEDGEELTGDRLLVAIGRRVRTDGLGLEAVGLEPGEPIEVDDALRVPDQPWLYAIGDVNGRAQLTHMGKYQARVAVDAILGGSLRVRGDGPLSPRAIFTDPGVAAVGHTLASAQEAGIAARAIDRDTSANAGASFHGRNAPGTTRFVLDAERELLIGATFVGPDVAELLHAATIAIVGEVPLATLQHAIPAFPTRSELWLDLRVAD
ncbi:MAG: FAD-dependent oxidoreductase, partial [Conexibacter sp.]